MRTTFAVRDECLRFIRQHIWLSAGGEGHPEAAVRADRVPAGALQHRRPPLPGDVHLRHHRHRAVRQHPAQRRHRRHHELRDVRQQHDPPLQVCPQNSGLSLPLMTSTLC